MDKEILKIYIYIDVFETVCYQIFGKPILFFKLIINCQYLFYDLNFYGASHFYNLYLTLIAWC